MKIGRLRWLDKLLQTPFFKGYGSVLDLSGNSHYSHRPAGSLQTDLQALEADFGCIGRDMWDIMLNNEGEPCNSQMSHYSHHQ